MHSLVLAYCRTCWKSCFVFCLPFGKGDSAPAVRGWGCSSTSAPARGPGDAARPMGEQPAPGAPAARPKNPAPSCPAGGGVVFIRVNTEPLKPRLGRSPSASETAAAPGEPGRGEPRVLMRFRAIKPSASHGPHPLPEGDGMCRTHRISLSVAFLPLPGSLPTPLQLTATAGRHS